MSKSRKIYCCGCSSEVDARLTAGSEVYSHRKDLRELPFWKCDACGNFVGCHHKTTDRTRPLGCIPTPALKAARQRVHAAIDPIWQSGRIARRELYSMLAHLLDVEEYHTAEIRTVEQADDVCRMVKDLEAASA